MPSRSGKQHRAMEAAAHGHSTLGIPAKVGKEFVQADATGKKAYAGSRDKSANPVKAPKRTAATTSAAKLKPLPTLPKHPGEEHLPAMHTSKHH